MVPSHFGEIHIHSTPASSDLTSQLGALEIGALPAPGQRIGDAALEGNGLAAVPGNTQNFNCPTNPVLCHRIDDAALEPNGLMAGPNPMGPPGFPARTHVVFGHCSGLDDDATLEANGLMAGPPPTTPPNGCPLRPTMICPRIDDGLAVGDGALEATASFGAAPSGNSITCLPATALCRRIDDGALEASALSVTGPTDTGPCRPTSPIFCRRIDDRLALEDGALEASAGFDVAPSGNIGCLPVTALCRHIDDATLEQSALRAEPHQTFAGATCPIYSCRRIDDDATLEANGLVAGPNQTQGSLCTLQCHHIGDDAALEAMTGVGGGPTSSAGGCKPITYVPCRADA